MTLNVSGDSKLQYCRKWRAQDIGDKGFAKSYNADSSGPKLRVGEERKGSTLRPRTKKLIAILIVVSVVVIACLIAFLPNLLKTGNQTGQVSGSPNVAIVSKDFRFSHGILYVDVIVHNSGGPGTACITAEASMDSGSYLTYSQVVFLASQESQNVTFCFSSTGGMGNWVAEDRYYSTWIEWQRQGT